MKWEGEKFPISPSFFGGMILTRGMILRVVEAFSFGSSCNREDFYSVSAVAMGWENLFLSMFKIGNWGLEWDLEEPRFIPIGDWNVLEFQSL